MADSSNPIDGTRPHAAVSTSESAAFVTHSFQPPTDADGRLSGALAIFGLAVAIFLILLVMVSASNA